MVNILYDKNGKLFTSQYTELYIPEIYFEDGFAEDKGDNITSLGLVYIRSFPGGKPDSIKFLNLPIEMDFMKYDIEVGEIKIHGNTIPVKILKYIKDSFICNQNVPQGRLISETFVKYLLHGKLPKTINYTDLLNIWWKNLEISGINFKVPSKIYEIILSNLYRNARNKKERYGQSFGKSSDSSGYGYQTMNVRSVVEGLSTFSGMVFEDMNQMITSAINNSIEGIEEPISPLEKIIYY